MFIINFCNQLWLGFSNVLNNFRNYVWKCMRCQLWTPPGYNTSCLRTIVQYMCTVVCNAAKEAVQALVNNSNPFFTS